MGESVVNLNGLTPDQIVAFFATFKKDAELVKTFTGLLGSNGATLAAFITKAEAVADTVEPWVEKPGFTDMVNFFLGLFQSGASPAIIAKAIAAAKAAL
jgi:hypothetical protein